MKTDAIVIKGTDNVATALRDILAGEEVTIGMGEEGRLVRVQGSIPYGHKFAVRGIAQGRMSLNMGRLSEGRRILSRLGPAPYPEH
jgi:hypothetical protein